MGIASFDEDCIGVIRRLANSEHLAVVVGAGASIPAELPGWEELVHRLLLKRRTRRDREVAELLTSTQGYLLAAEAAFPYRTSPAMRKKKVARALYGKDPRGSFIPSQLHQAVACLAARRQSSGLQIFTTNYDNLLEQALTDEGLRCRARYAARNTAASGTIPVHHIHGYLGPESESDDIVVGQSDYARVTDAHSDWPAEEISAVAGRGPVVFVGASLTDPNLLRMLERIRGRDYDPHVLVLARQGLKVPCGVHGQFRERLTAQWQRYNVEVVLLDDFCDVSLFVREVAVASRSGYVGPRERVRSLWTFISSHFAEAQQDFAVALEEGFQEHLRTIIGEEANLVLWLVDGNGSLVRFAASDRLHRSPAALRRIPDRHDTGWVVSESVAFETTAVRPLSESGGPEAQVPDRRWNRIAAVPLRPHLGGVGPIISGALSAATVTVDLTADSLASLAGALENDLAGEWETRLQALYS